MFTFKSIQSFCVSTFDAAVPVVIAASLTAAVVAVDVTEVSLKVVANAAVDAHAYVVSKQTLLHAQQNARYGYAIVRARS